MKKIKKTFITSALGILIGLMLSKITLTLNVNEIIALVLILVLFACVIVTIAYDDINVRLKKSYERGFKLGKETPAHMNCRCHIETHEENQ